MTLSFGADAGAARRERRGRRRGDPGGDGAERLGQVDPAALPRRHPGARRRRDPLRRAAHRHAARAERSALRRDRFGFVFQFGQLVPELTAEENVALPLLLGGVAPGARRSPGPGSGSRGWAWTGLERRRSGELSGGEAQRVALARGLVAEPAGAVRRRADRLAGLADRRARHGPAVGRRPRAGHHGRPGDPRAPGRRLRRPRGRRPRRPGHRP